MNLHKIELDFEKSLLFMKNNLEGGNTLSMELLKSIDFQKGKFFTLLPDTANSNQLYAFREAGILPATPAKRYVMDDSNATYSAIPTIQKDVVPLLSQHIHHGMTCVFEDVLTTIESTHLSFFNESNSLYNYKSEVYYKVNENVYRNDIIKKCLEESNAFWHSLCVITTWSTKDLKCTKLSSETIKEICLKTQVVMLGAYDGEGYVFWERLK